MITRRYGMGGAKSCLQPEDGCISVEQDISAAEQDVIWLRVA